MLPRSGRGTLSPGLSRGGHFPHQPKLTRAALGSNFSRELLTARAIGFAHRHQAFRLLEVQSASELQRRRAQHAPPQSRRECPQPQQFESHAALVRMRRDRASSAANGPAWQDERRQQSRQLPVPPAFLVASNDRHAGELLRDARIER